PYSFDQYFSSFQYTYLASLPTGFAWNSNNLAIVMVLFLPLFMIYENKNLYLKVITFCIPVVILMSGSRAAILGFFVVFVLYMIIKRNIKVLSVSILMVMLVVVNIEKLDN